MHHIMDKFLLSIIVKLLELNIDEINFTNYETNIKDINNAHSKNNINIKY